jgi:hypothetical protein
MTEVTRSINPLETLKQAVDIREDKRDVFNGAIASLRLCVLMQLRKEQ